jgi:hypothetical protein
MSAGSAGSPQLAILKRIHVVGDCCGENRLPGVSRKPAS